MENKLPQAIPINIPQQIFKINKQKRRISPTGQSMEEEVINVEAPNRKDCEEMFERWK